MEPAALEKFSKPPVNKSAFPTTPSLPPHAPLAIKRNNSIGSTDKPPEVLPLERPTRPLVNRTVTSAPPTPLPYRSSAAMRKIMFDPKKLGAASSVVGTSNVGGAGGMSARNKGMTPIRIKPKYNNDEVAATDTTRTNVAKLSAWLADDPTTVKKVKQIRRGANVIAKSRKFDKGLANVIVEQNNIRAGSVASKKQWLEVASSTEDSTNNTDDDFTLSQDCVSDKSNWLDGQRMIDEAAKQNSASSTISVSNKKAWLNNAFQKKDGTNKFVPKASTDIVTSQTERDDLSSRAKHMWRNRAPSNRGLAVPRSPIKPRTPVKETATSSSIYKKGTPVKPSPAKEAPASKEHSAKERSIFKLETEVEPDARREIIAALPALPFPTLPSPEHEDQPADAPCDLSPIKPRIPVKEESTSEESTSTVKEESASTSTYEEGTATNPSPTKEAPAPKEISAAKRSIFRQQAEVKPDARREIIDAFPALPFSNSMYKSPYNERSIFKPQTDVKPDARREITAAFPTLPFSTLPSPEHKDEPASFHSARDMLVQRSKTYGNGKGVEVLSKVKIRKAKYERLQKDSQRMSGAHGLLKTSWDEADAEAGRPSDAYVKTFKEDIAPKRSLEELP
jgi:hypothetical protein